MVELSSLEKAINSVVTQFHSAAGGGSTMNSSQFKDMLSKELPLLGKTVESEDGMAKVMQQMGVKSGENISFENFWKLFNNQAVELFKTMYKEKSPKCNCLLQ
uniref:S100/CaBP-9k-type calcium binding subdomain domain-containing protein n=1 Tax=Oryzias melastigma TaxID=30732 RepID=A0A3B3BFU8_ORYME